VRTLMGRRRYIPEIQSTLPMEIAQGERQAVNTIIQGTASDLLKKAMLAVEERLICWPNPETKPKIILQIHDELIYEMKLSDAAANADGFGSSLPGQLPSEVEIFIQLLSDCMESISGWAVPTPTNIQVGYTWGEMIKYTPTSTASSSSSSGHHLAATAVASAKESEAPAKKMRRSVD
jgi:DNA polymerase I